MVNRPGDYYWSSYSAYLEQHLNNEIVDTAFVLGMLSNNKASAIKEFERFSNESDETTFLECEDENEIQTLAEGRIFLANYLEAKWAGQLWTELRKDRTSRQEIIRHLKTQTGLSVRAISELLGISKNSVH